MHLYYRADEPEILTDSVFQFQLQFQLYIFFFQLQLT